jgi:hypothetical protein
VLIFGIGEVYVDLPNMSLSDVNCYVSDLLPPEWEESPHVRLLWLSDG